MFFKIYIINYDILSKVNIDKAKKILNWVPKSSLSQMIEDEWRFYRNTLTGN